MTGTTDWGKRSYSDAPTRRSGVVPACTTSIRSSMARRSTARSIGTGEVSHVHQSA
jgi:hypothetical protein